MNTLHWRRILLAAFLAELAVMVLLTPLYFLFGEDSLLYAISPASFVTSMAGGWWVARKAEQKQVLHGALVGVVAVLLYAVLTGARRVPAAYLIAHLFKIAGGALGGRRAARGATKQEPLG